MADTARQPVGFIVAVVIFWLLTVGAAGTAFVFYQETEQARIHTDQLGVQTRTLVEDTVALEDKVNKVRGTLDSDAATDDDAAASVKGKLGQAPTIAAAFALSDQVIAARKADRDNLAAQKADVDQQLARVKLEQGAADAAFADIIRKIEQRIADRTAAINAEVARLTAIVAGITKRVDDADAETTKERDEMLKERIDYDRRLRLLVGKRNDLKDQLRLTLQFSPSIVGRVLGANMALNFTFVSLGKKQGVTEGMRFSVYPANTVFRTGLKPKAVIEVKRLEDDRSQGQVVKQNLSDPVVSGDVLVNIAFDPAGRKPTFELIRFLDITGDNVDDRDTLIKIIRQQGGEVLPPDANAVTVDTDYILIGQEWNYANPDEKQYQERDNPIMEKAGRRSVTQLDTDTFLNYIGYPKWK